MLQIFLLKKYSFEQVELLALIFRPPESIYLKNTKLLVLLGIR